MFCPNCEAEFREGFTVCSDCEVALVAVLGEVAAIRPDAPDALEPFHETRSADELALLLERLEDERVPYVVQAGTALALLTSEELGEPGQPDGWEARVLVTAPRLALAKTLLATLRTEWAAAAAGRAGATPLDPA